MLNLYDPAMSPSVVVVRLMTGKRTVSREHSAQGRSTQSQVLFLMEPVDGTQNLSEESCDAQPVRRVA